MASVTIIRYVWFGRQSWQSWPIMNRYALNQHAHLFWPATFVPGKRINPFYLCIDIFRWRACEIGFGCGPTTWPSMCLASKLTPWIKSGRPESSSLKHCYLKCFFCLVVLHHHDRNWPVSKAGLLQALNDDRLCVRTSEKDSLIVSIFSNLFF